jgi:hypothetical protein
MCLGFSYNISYDDAIALPNRIGEFQILADNGRTGSQLLLSGDLTQNPQYSHFQCNH